MGEKAPVDEYGMPYLLHPFDPPHANSSVWKDEDHSFYQRRSPELTDMAGRALRCSRVQETPRWLHNRKHRAFPDGTHLPKSEKEKFGLTILACAGYVSWMALDVRNVDNPTLVRASRNVHNYMRGKQQLHFETKKNMRLEYRTVDAASKSIGMYIADYAKRQNITELVDDTLLDEFLSTPDDSKRLRLGNKIIGFAIDAAIDPIKPVYRSALQNELIRPGITHPFPLVTTLFPPQEWPKYHETLAELIVAA